MLYQYDITLDDDETQLLAELTAYHKAQTYKTPVYVETPYGTMPAANWTAYQSATAD